MLETGKMAAAEVGLRGIWSLVGWHIPVVPALEKQRQELKASLICTEF